MEGVNHVHVVQIRRGRLVGQIHRMLEGQVPDGEGLELGVARSDAPLVVVVELGEAGGHLAAAGARRRHHHQRVRGLHILILSKALVADNVLHVGGVARDGIVAVAPDAQGGQPLQKGVRRPLAAVPAHHHAAHIEAHAPEDVDQPQHVVVIGDAQVPPDLVFLDVCGVDGNEDLHVVLQLLEHPDLAVRLESRQHPGGVVVVEQLAAELQIQLAAELGDALFDLLGLGGEVLLIVKTDGRHTIFPFSLWLFKIR